LGRWGVGLPPASGCSTAGTSPHPTPHNQHDRSDQAVLPHHHTGAATPCSGLEYEKEASKKPSVTLTQALCSLRFLRNFSQRASVRCDNRVLQGTRFPTTA
jgi:hypothetical protein